MHLVIIKAIENGTASLFQLLGPVDVVLLVKAGTQLHQSHHFLAVFGGFDQGLHDLGFPRHPVKVILMEMTSGSRAAFFSIAMKGRMD